MDTSAHLALSAAVLGMARGAVALLAAVRGAQAVAVAAAAASTAGMAADPAPTRTVLVARGAAMRTAAVVATVMSKLSLPVKTLLD